MVLLGAPEVADVPLNVLLTEPLAVTLWVWLVLGTLTLLPVAVALVDPAAVTLWVCPLEATEVVDKLKTPLEQEKPVATVVVPIGVPDVTAEPVNECV